jgi:hypothetical protein
MVAYVLLVFYCRFMAFEGSGAGMAYFGAAWNEAGAALCSCGRLRRRRHAAQNFRMPMLLLLARAIGLAMLLASFATCRANAQQADETVFAPYVRAAAGPTPR